MKLRAERGSDPSEANLDVLEYQLSSMEPLTEEERRFGCVEVDTTSQLDLNAFCWKVAEKAFPSRLTTYIPRGSQRELENSP